MTISIGDFGSMGGTPPASDTFFSNDIATRGKHAGKSFTYLLTNHPHYLAWLIDQPGGKLGLTPQQMGLIKVTAAQAEDDADDRKRATRARLKDHGYDKTVRNESNEFWDKDD